ncbi:MULTISPECIES: hypothetical protein [Halobacterium]|uniref:hypothetical protein n=1 Tax=Halobacterium TaxID=2239 RepID=UPI00073E64A1|nr:MULTISPECIES: hypothetical protein [Halobacterium]MCG1002815.1 hypothetical protein [Halobacterium noricense]
MSHSGVPGSGDPGTTPCPADGPLDPGRSAVEAVECNSARFVNLAHSSRGVQPTYLVLTDSDVDGTQLSLTDVLSMPEIQNAVAYFGADTDSVRVRTQSGRRKALEEHVDALAERSSAPAFEFGDRCFELSVVLG